MLWLALAFLAALSAAVLSFALLRRSRHVAPRAAHDLEVYRAQLKELERERETGLISEAEAGAARLEIERRILAADPEQAPDEAAAPKGRERIPAAAIAAAVPLAAFGLYLALGSPEVPSVTFREQAALLAQEAGAQDPQAQADAVHIETMLERVRERLEQDPGNLRDWVVLASSLTALGRFAEAATAYGHALRLSGEDPALYSAHAEALIFAAQGQVTGEARVSLNRALALDPENPRARFYAAVGRQQIGDLEGAFGDLAALLRGAPADAPWLEVVRQRALGLAADLGLDPALALPPPPAAGLGPSREDMEAVAEMTPEEQKEMIRGMVGGLAERLEDEPDNLQGWQMLARSYGVLGERAKAAEAYGRVLALAPDDPDALFFLGEAALEAGDAAQATAYWTRLLAQLAPGSAEHALVQDRLNDLEAAN